MSSEVKNNICDENNCDDPFDYEITKDGEQEKCIVENHSILSVKTKNDKLTGFSIFDQDDPDREDAVNKLKSRNFASLAEDKAFGCFLGNVIGDAIGIQSNGRILRYDNNGIIDMGKTYRTYGRYRLKKGQWTSYGSMALCLADSLIVNNFELDPMDCMLRYIAWNYLGYDNSFANDESRSNKKSVGINKNLKNILVSFKQSGSLTHQVGCEPETLAIARLSPIFVLNHNNIEEAEEMAIESVLVTHNTNILGECARLLAFCCTGAIYSNHIRNPTFLSCLHELGFESANYPIYCLSTSTNDNIDRNWNWKDSDYKYNRSSAEDQSREAGSYAMDALAMALSCVYNTRSFEEAMLRGANLSGAACSLCAVIGQLAGSIYGISAIPKEWISSVEGWDPGDDIPLRAYKLFHKKS
jgi:ADP-ribosyl-[dinitrogen reductase] hydrolase